MYFISPDNHSSTPCSDSGHSSPGMTEDEAHQHPTAHPLSRSGMTSYRGPPSHQPNHHNHQLQPPMIGQHCHYANKRHRTGSEVEDSDDHDMSPIKKIPPTSIHNNINNLGLKASMHAHAQYMMQQQGRIGLHHESSARLPNTSESAQRLVVSDRAATAESQHHIHPRSRQVDPLHHPHHHDSRGRMFAGYPIPMHLPYIDSCGSSRNRTMYFGSADENGGMYRHHDEETDEDDIFSNGEKPSGKVDPPRR